MVAIVILTVSAGKVLQSVVSVRSVRASVSTQSLVQLTFDLDLLQHVDCDHSLSGSESQGQGQGHGYGYS